jgi:hypothetical protein
MQESYTYYLQRAADENLTSSEILQMWNNQLPWMRIFGSDKTTEILRRLASNPNLPPELAAQCLVSFSKEFSTNPAIPLLFIEDPRFLERVDEPRLLQLLSTENVAPLILQMLQSHSKPRIKEAAKSHVNFAGEVEGEDWQDQVRQKIAQLPVGNKTKLKELHQWGCVPEWLAAKYRLDPIIPRIVEPDVWRHWTGPDEAQPDEKKWKKIRHAVKSIALVDFPATNAKEAFQYLEHASRVEQSSQILRYIFENTAFFPPQLAKNPFTPEDVMLSLLPEQNEILLSNPGITTQVIQKLSLKYLREVINNSRTPTLLLEKYFLTLDIVVQRFHVNEIAMQLLKRKNTSIDTAKSAFLYLQCQETKRNLVGLLVFAHLSKTNMFIEAGDDIEWSNWLGIALNPNSTLPILQDLVKHGNRYIRAVARARLASVEPDIIVASDVL